MNYPDYVIRQVEENSGSLGQIPFIFYQKTAIGLKIKEPYVLTIGNKKEN